MAFTSFSLCLIVAALECRSETETVLTTATFDSKQMNWTLLAEFALAVLVTQMDVFNRLLDTTPITLAQFGWALVPALGPAGALGAGQARRPGGGRPTSAAAAAARPRAHVRPAIPAARARSPDAAGGGSDGRPLQRSATRGARRRRRPRSSPSGTDLALRPLWAILGSNQ